MKLILYGDPKTKKNHTNIIPIGGGKFRLVQSKYYAKYEKDCLKQILGEYKQRINYPVNVKCVFYKQSRIKVDLTNLLGAIDDILVKAEVLEDDNRNIIAKHDGSVVLYDKENPRVEIEIEKMEDYEQWISKRKKLS